MVHKIKVFRKWFTDEHGYHRESSAGFAPVMEAIKKYGLGEALVKRKTKLDIIGSPSGCNLVDSTCEIFFFRYVYKTRAEFFGKLAALKDDLTIFKYFWIGD